MSTTGIKQNRDPLIISMIRNRDQKFLDLIYEDYASILMRIALSIVRSDSIAEDVLQESLVKIWKNSERFDPDKAALLTWMVQITRNTALDHVRSKSARKAQITDTMENNTSAGRIKDGGLNVEHIGLEDLIKDQLDPQDQQILNMLYFEGFTQKEVAEELEMPLGSVKTRVRITVNHLRNLFKP